ncbi:hypothetical protein CALCODRAFT_297268 [Calocera cornea HHB12733]|uniref:Uncharacterized protein n=1 Tax=Calocera cornea HHB12733 TaxID=1353952 RepID=A0A165FLW1_9BASI|nr:hypothetical protein CALCODRAFT_297268 [Calocera cornea HHB12733]
MKPCGELQAARDRTRHATSPGGDQRGSQGPTTLLVINHLPTTRREQCRTKQSKAVWSERTCYVRYVGKAHERGGAGSAAHRRMLRRSAFADAPGRVPRSPTTSSENCAWITNHLLDCDTAWHLSLLTIHFSGHFNAGYDSPSRRSLRSGCGAG